MPDGPYYELTETLDQICKHTVFLEFSSPAWHEVILIKTADAGEVKGIMQRWFKRRFQISQKLAASTKGPSSYPAPQRTLQQSCRSHAAAPGALSTACEGSFLSHFLVILRSYCSSPSSRLRSNSRSRAIEWISLFSLLKSQQVLLPWQWDLSGT